MSTPDRRRVTNALRDLIESTTGYRTGKKRAPKDADGIVEPYPYVVIHPMEGGFFSGTPYHHPDADVGWRYAVHSFSENEEQAEAMGDKVRQAILGRDDTGRFESELIVTDLTVMQRAPYGSPGPVHSAGNVFYVVDAYTIYVTTS